jgi:2-keto-4-pentenoate hydratase/2-oxohepta-3-ene-1,7-dioic acid hydratase in catechol pathway
MHLITFSDSAGPGLGLLDADATAMIDLRGAEAIPGNMLSLIASGAAGLEQVRRAADSAARPRVALVDVRLLAPIPTPARNLFCVGKNYFEHAREFQASGFDASAGQEVRPEAPIVFTKAPSSVIGPGEPIPSHLDPTGSTDYEGELAVVIGTGGRGIPRDQAWAHVYGYTIVNDVTARALQKRHKQWFLGKSIDGFCPMGPALVTADAIPDVTDLRLVTTVNGEVRQDASLADLMFDIPELIETLSAGITLQPGDIIATGTPVGVGIGFDPPRFLQPGDDVRVRIAPIGELRNPVA